MAPGFRRGTGRLYRRTWRPTRPRVSPRYMDPSAIDAVINQCRTRESAVEVYRASVVAAGKPCPTVGAATDALYAAIRTSGWALLVAPELHAAYQEWQACCRFEDDLAELRRLRDRVAEGIDKPATMVLVEVKSDKVYESKAGLIGERKVGPDMLSVRAAAYAKLAAEVTRAEEAYARARTRFVRAVYAYQRAMEPVRSMEPRDLAKLILSQSYREGDLAIARAAIDEGQAALQSGVVDRVMSSLRSRLDQRSTIEAP